MRGAVAQQSGLDESLASVAISRDHQSLSPSHRAALVLADAIMTQPGDIDAVAADELRRHFSDDELVELTLDIMKWNYQKVAVALGVDVEVRPGQLTDLEFDDQGHWKRSG